MASFLEVLFPRRCLGCGAFGAYICESCLNSLHPLREPVCPRCDSPSILGQTHERCQRTYGMAGLVSVFPYAGVAKKLVTHFKYRFVQDLLATVVELIISDGDLTLLERLEPVVVGVPLHPRRERYRGFNQADLLGKALAGELGWVFQANVLKRVRYTTPQMQLSGEKRRRNLIGVFTKSLGIEAVMGRKVVLVDDVWTTGTTMRECTKVLHRAGANKVYGLTFARSV